MTPELWRAANDEARGVLRGSMKNANFAKMYGAGMHKVSTLVGVPITRADFSRYDEVFGALDKSAQKIVKFAIQYQKRGRWHTILEGGKIGEDGRYEKEFEPVTARKVRLNITEAKTTPRIFEFQILAAE